MRDRGSILTKASRATLSTSASGERHNRSGPRTPPRPAHAQTRGRWRRSIDHSRTPPSLMGRPSPSRRFLAGFRQPPSCAPLVPLSPRGITSYPNTTRDAAGNIVDYAPTRLLAGTIRNPGGYPYRETVHLYCVSAAAYVRRPVLPPDTTGAPAPHRTNGEWREAVVYRDFCGNWTCENRQDVSP